MRRAWLWSVLLLLVGGVAALAQGPPDGVATPQTGELLLADFEDEAEIEAFTTRDSNRTADPESGRPLVYVFLSGLTPAGGGEHSMHIMFNDGDNAWAGVYTDVNGAEWAAAGARALGFAANSYLGTLSVDLVLTTADGERYTATVEIPSEGWVPVVAPLSSFVSGTGKHASEVLESVTSLGFEKRGTWRGCVLRIDQLRLLPEAPGTSVIPPPDGPDPGTAPPGTADQRGGAPVVPPTQAYKVSLSTTFQARENPIYFRTYLGMNAAMADMPLLESPQVQSLVRAIDPIVRLIVETPLQASADAAMHSRVDPLIAAARRVAKDRGVMVCIDAPIGGEVPPQRFSEFAAGMVRRHNFGPDGKRVTNPIRYWELLAEPILLTDSDYAMAIQMYNAAAKAMRTVDNEIRLGGMALFASEQQPIDRILRGTKGQLDFLSWHFYGAASVSVTNEELLKAADSGLTYGVANAVAPTRILELLRVADLYESGLLFVSECNLNKARTADGRCQDPRASTSFAAAWLASYFVSAGPIVDVTLISRLSGETWGMINADGSAGPVYWTARLFKEHMPRGAEVLGVRSSERAGNLRALAGMLGDRRMVLMVNRQNQSAEVDLTMAGLDARTQGTLYRLTPNGRGIETVGLTLQTAAASLPQGTPATHRVTGIVLPPYGVAIAEFGPRGPMG